VIRIVSGGQSGVDRGALDAALDRGVPCGGWCPPGRRAEDGPIPQRYPVSALDHGGYAQRTRRNVVDSDGTVILYEHVLEGGTALTAALCRGQAKPCLVLDASRLSPEAAAGSILRFMDRHHIAVLNVAGPRASKWPAAHGYAYRAILRVLGVLSGG